MDKEKIEKEKYRTLAYQYGLLDPIDWAQDAHDQLWLMNRLWNTLVEIEHTHREKYRTLVGADDVVFPLQTRLDALRAKKDDVYAERKNLRQRARSKVPTPDLDLRLKALSDQIKAIAPECKNARKVAKDRIQPAVEALNIERFAAVKAARNASQLYWGNYNAVCRSYETARARAMKDGTELRFRRFTGEGRFVVQIINGARLEDITGGRKQVRLDMTPSVVPNRKGQPRPRLEITIYTNKGEPRLLTFPIVLDRPLPEEARIQEVTVTRRKLGTNWRWAVTFTLRLPDTIPVVSTSSRIAGINLGFRQMPGGLRIATLYDGEHCETMELPWHWMSELDKVEAMRQRRDFALNEVRTMLRAAWPERPDNGPESLTERLGNLLRAPKCSSASLASIILRWREYDQWWPTMLEKLEAWRRIDKTNLGYEANTRAQLMLSRRERYRLFARQITSRYGVVRIGKIDLRRMAQLDSPDGTENELHQRARRNRQRASLYSLQQEIRLQALKFGTRIDTVDGSFTATCHICSALCAVDASLIHICQACAACWDQDVNAARNIFAAPTERLDGDDNAGERSQLGNQAVTGL